MQTNTPRLPESYSKSLVLAHLTVSDKEYIGNVDSGEQYSLSMLYATA